MPSASSSPGGLPKSDDMMRPGVWRAVWTPRSTRIKRGPYICGCLDPFTQPLKSIDRLFLLVCAKIGKTVVFGYVQNPSSGASIPGLRLGPNIMLHDAVRNSLIVRNLLIALLELGLCGLPRFLSLPFPTLGFTTTRSAVFPDNLHNCNA